MEGERHTTHTSATIPITVTVTVTVTTTITTAVLRIIIVYCHACLILDLKIVQYYRRSIASECSSILIIDYSAAFSKRVCGMKGQQHRLLNDCIS